MTIVRNDFLKLWKILYPDQSVKLLDIFLSELKELKEEVLKIENTNSLWYKDAVVYSLYVDLFNKDFDGLKDKVQYLKDLGINCLWLLPILESPMKDAGFDISDYRQIRSDILGKEGDSSFDDFLKTVRKAGIKVIFDIAINHTSNQHIWFKKSALPEKNKYTDYYIWSDNDRGYNECRLLFKGMCDSNWEKYDDNRFYFHRFFEFQPDLNYKNPNVLLDMCRNLMFWIEKGVDGFRADAIPYLWKEEGTSCENLEKTHVIIKFFRTLIEYLNPSVILLAEACQPPYEVVKYMGEGDECHAGYHFPLMPQIFKSIALQSSAPIKQVLSKEITPEIPEMCQWFTFLRCHDELSLEDVYVNEEDRKYIYKNYCHNPEWDFRLGEGISARLSELFKFEEDKILLAFSMIFTLPGTPVIYYGDEFGKPNDEDYYNAQILLTGHNDTRNRVRGKVNWNELEQKLNNKKSLEYRIFHSLKNMIASRKKNPAFSMGSMVFVDAPDNILAFKREYNGNKLFVVYNLGDSAVSIEKLLPEKHDIIYGNFQNNENSKLIGSHKTIWFKFV
ncbi:MAG TPA: alpha-amylase family glycosyl hydrolase [Bacteroidales bacterium]|nr:alpha-amylase family glycosyl hydrolase [Bacteroidales bacterium]